MIRFDRQNARRSREVGLGLDQRRGATIGGHADVFEDVSTQHEAYVVREGIECLPSLDQSSRDG